MQNHSLLGSLQFAVCSLQLRRRVFSCAVGGATKTANCKLQTANSSQLQTPNCKLQTAFTLVEMLVVIGIIAVLTAASVVGYSKVTASAEKAKCNELVKNVQTALIKVYNDNDGAWPRALVSGASAGRLDEKASLPLADLMGLNKSNNALTGYDKFGIVSPWAAQAIKAQGDNATTGSKVPSGGTIYDHVLHYAIDLEGNGVILDAVVGGESVSCRGTAMVWCAGRDGVEEAYSSGLRKDDVYSWTPGETQNVQ